MEDLDNKDNLYKLSDIVSDHETRLSVAESSIKSMSNKIDSLLTKVEVNSELQKSLQANLRSDIMQQQDSLRNDIVRQLDPINSILSLVKGIRNLIITLGAILIFVSKYGKGIEQFILNLPFYK